MFRISTKAKYLNSDKALILWLSKKPKKIYKHDMRNDFVFKHGTVPPNIAVRTHMVQVSNPIAERYEEFLGLIKSLCEAYDSQENDVIALSISTAIRVLVHDTDKSTSLLTHVAKKESKYISTNFNNKREAVHLGLVRRINVGVIEGVGGEAKYWPLCDERHFTAPVSEKIVDFNIWWSGEKVFKSSKASLTRRDIILFVANKDGGAHFDTKVQEKYDHFRKTWSGGSSLVGINSGIKRGYDNIPTYPAVRQIAYELLSSLQP